MARIQNLRGYQLWLAGRAFQAKPSKPEMLALIRERLRGMEARQETRVARRSRIRARERDREQKRARAAAPQQMVIETSTISI